MEQFKIDNFTKDNLGHQFPKFKSLTHLEQKLLRRELSN